MTADAQVCELSDCYRAYVEVLEALGHAVETSAVASHLSADDGERLETLLAEAVEGKEPDGPVEDGVVERMRELTASLIEEVAQAAREVCDGRQTAQGVAEALRKAAEADREAAADTVLLNGHRQFLRGRSCRLSELHRILDERGDQDELALVKLVPFVRRELARRGIEAGDEEISSWFEPEAEDRDVPHCLKRILSGINGEFETGLIELEEMIGDADPDEWLEDVRVRLLFRSHSAMHKAIAEATSLKYDCVHKALSGRQKAKRIQAEVKYCIEVWLRDLEEGREPDIDDDYRGVPVERMHVLLPALEKAFPTKEEIYRTVSSRTHVKTGSVRRYFQSNGQLKYAPLSVYRCARALADGKVAQAPPSRDSYLADRRTRRLADELARKARDTLQRWRAEGDAPELEIAFKEIRRALIVTIKENRHTEPSSSAGC